MGQVAYAAGDYPAANSISVNGYDFGLPNSLYYKNCDTDTGNNSSDYNAHYDPNTGILELRNYVGGMIHIGGAVTSNITIKLVGENIITGTDRGIENSNGGDITITADKDSNAKLVINVENSGNVEGISAGTDAAHTTGSVTLTGYADVTVNTTTTEEYKYAYGIHGKVNASVIEHASFKAICSGPNGGYGYGIYAAEGVTINTDGIIEIDVTGCASTNTACIGGTKAHTLTKVGNGIFKYPSSSGAISPATSKFSESTHAINKDTINRVESYR